MRGGLDTFLVVWGESAELLLGSVLTDVGVVAHGWEKANMERPQSLPALSGKLARSCCARIKAVFLTVSLSA